MTPPDRPGIGTRGAPSRNGLAPLRFTRTELAGAVADLGVLVPIAVALIVGNGLSATPVLVPAGLLYVASGLVYRLPVPVQPLKAFGAIAIAQGLGTSEIAAGALLMGTVFLALGATGVLDGVARWFPRPVIRGIQISVGLLFLRIAYGFVAAPPPAFADQARAPWLLAALTLGAAVLALALRRHGVALALVTVAVAVAVLRSAGNLTLGPSPLAVPQLGAAAFATALTALVVPQLPLTFANSCLATADAARTYFGPRQARRVTPSRLAVTLGLANLGAGVVGGMPVCHGAGGLSSHHAFGARTGGAPIALGAALVIVGIGAGAGLGQVLSAFPLPVLAALLGVAGLAHLALARDLRGVWPWTVALGVGVLGLLGNLAVALLVGLALWWGRVAGERLTRSRSERSTEAPPPGG
jgi:SulP family sulfate permease